MIPSNYRGGKQGWERKWIVIDKNVLKIYENQNTVGEWQNGVPFDSFSRPINKIGN